MKEQITPTSTPKKTPGLPPEKVGEKNLKPEVENQKRDLITEEEFNEQALEAGVDHTLPDTDSPGDSEEDTEAEIMMGMAYDPESEDVADEDGSEPRHQRAHSRISTRDFLGPTRAAR